MPNPSDTADGYTWNPGNNGELAYLRDHEFVGSSMKFGPGLHSLVLCSAVQHGRGLMRFQQVGNGQKKREDIFVHISINVPT